MATARHPQASVFVQQKLFAELATFAELEQRIAHLPDEKARGDAFEVFAEAYLATQRKHDADAVWPLAGVPTDLLAALKLGTQDYGIDGVLKTRLGNHSAYQVKFRTGRPALTWRELSTFMGLADSPNIHSRILLTNCDELPAVLNDRQGFFCIRGTDLDRLEAGDFQAIAAWLADSVYSAPRKTPQPHQAEALEKILPAFQEHDRVSAIMACGTGKTLVALWVAEDVARASSPASSGGVPAARILVLLPSLALLRQTLHEWLRETSLPSLAYLCVCSDGTVKEGVDALTTAQADLDFEVSTNAASVRAFLDASFAGTKIIFSTYQSASVVGEALRLGAPSTVSARGENQPGLAETVFGAPPLECFDLGIFDEAHKTAGREGRNFALALEDKNLPIRKRLFVTATPRHYNPHQRDREGESKLVFSMDRPEVYGPQIYRLTSAEAARRGIICGYKVIISVITSERVTNELLSRGEVLVNGDAVLARQVANQIALRDVVEKYGTRKIFTFHKTVQSAQSFVSGGPEGVGTHLADVRSPGFSRSGPPEGGTPSFQTFHVNGTMPTARREHAMRDFRAAPLAVMSNARCLTEGVDVPAVDMVAFLSPRRSLVDIVQATGRAMRRAPGKTTGYVLVPLYVELAAGETIEAAVSRANFDEVWDVLQTMQEQDDVLAEYISQMAAEKGRTGKLNGTPCEQIEIIGEMVSVDALRNAIQTRCFEDLFSFWDIQYGRLLEFKNLHGHCRVAATDKFNPQLALWVSSQRKRKDELSKERIAKLESIGFQWDAFESIWQENFANLETFKAQHGHCRVPQGFGQNPKLARWVSTQRKTKEKLSPERIAKLDAIEFDWQNNGDEKWDRNYALLQKFKEQHGHCRVPNRFTANRQLGIWVHNQRHKYAKNVLSNDRVARLEAIGFEWGSRKPDWQEQFDNLVAFKAKSPDGFESNSFARNRPLKEWVNGQRRLHSEGKLSLERVSKLESIGFDWHISKKKWGEAWSDWFEKLVSFKAKHNHCRVTRFDEGFKGLGQWVHTQRRTYSEGKLAPERIAKLESIGFEWDVIESDWQEKYNQLVKFKSENGHCLVPKRFKENPQLGSWVANQRQTKESMSADHRQKLDALGFVWRVA